MGTGRKGPIRRRFRRKPAEEKPVAVRGDLRAAVSSGGAIWGHGTGERENQETEPDKYT